MECAGSRDPPSPRLRRASIKGKVTAHGRSEQAGRRASFKELRRKDDQQRRDATRNGPACRYFLSEGAGRGRSVFQVSTATFQFPSACFFQTATYFPRSIEDLPLSSGALIS